MVIANLIGFGMGSEGLREIINKIIDETGVKIDIEEDGRVFIYSSDSESAKKALEKYLEVRKKIIPKSKKDKDALFNNLDSIMNLAPK